MVRIGQKQKQKLLVHDTEEFIDPSFFRIKFEIKGKIFSKAVDDLLRFEREDLADITDGDLDKALDLCSYYRFTFLAAGAELETVLAKMEREFTTWYAETSEVTRKNIILARLEAKKEEKIPASWFGSITKQEIEQAIVISPIHQTVHEGFQSKISLLRKQIKILFGLRDILHDRGGHLQSIGRRRLENRKMRFRVMD